jgi:hypothetical protein
MGYLKTQAEAKELLATFTEFNAGTLTAQNELTEASTTRSLYVVRSYGVVIAISGAYELSVLPSAYSHSKTTSKHANIVAKAWGLK